MLSWASLLLKQTAFCEGKAFSFVGDAFSSNIPNVGDVGHPFNDCVWKCFDCWVVAGERRSLFSLCNLPGEGKLRVICTTRAREAVSSSRIFKESFWYLIAFSTFLKHLTHTPLSLSMSGSNWKLEITSQTRYDYNITIMKSPKLATDNRFKK